MQPIEQVIQKMRERGEHGGKVLDSSEGRDVIACETCGFVHISPLPDARALEQDYKDNYYDDVTRDRIAYYERDRDWWMVSYGDVLAEIENQLAPGSGRRLLDVGCGAGIFLEAASMAGWEATGVEPGHTAASHCQGKGLTVIEDTFEGAVSGLREPFDVVHMRNVLEHVPAPAAMIEEAARRLKPGGLLVAVVPNDYNPIQKALRKVEGYRPWWVAVKHHLNYFDFESLEGLVTARGFEPVSRFCSFPIDLFLAMGDNYVETPEIGRASHLRRVRMENLFEQAGLAETRRDLYRSFANAGLGREACVVARLKG